MIKLIAIPEKGSTSSFHTLHVKETNKHFGHTWINPTGYGEHTGKWTFNRGSLPIEYNWWPTKYEYDTMEQLIAYMEQNFPEEPLPYKPAYIEP